MERFINGKGYTFTAAGLIIAYICIACYKLTSPGLQYDEILFVNASRYTRHYNDFVLLSVKDFPVLLMPYIGALKSYIYFPITNLMGVNTWTIRFPVILITAISLGLITILIKKSISKEVALATLFLLIIDPTFIFMTRLDVGPNVLELFFKCLSLLLFYRYFIEKKSNYNLLLGFLTLGLGLFNKLNFLWFINALYAAIFLFEGIKYKNVLLYKNKDRIGTYVFILLSYIVYFLYFIIIAKSYNFESDVDSSSIFNGIEYKMGNIRRLLNGTGFLGYIYGLEEQKIHLYILYLYGLIISVGGILNAFLVKNEFIKKNRHIFGFLILIITLEIIQILLTAKATAPWHSFVLYPFCTTLLVYSIFSIFHVISLNNKKNQTIALIGTICCIGLYQLAVLLTYFNILGTPTSNIAWSDKIYELADYTKQSNKQFVSLDWGIHNALIAFDHKKGKYHEVLWILNDKMTNEEKNSIKKTFINDSTIFVTHANKKVIFSKPMEHLKILGEEEKMTLVKDTTIRDGEEGVYELYSFKEVK